EFEKVLRECGISPEGKDFLFGLLTQSEIIMLGRRVQIARRLLQGHSSKKIERELKVGQTTVQAVHQWLQKKIPGYRRALPAVPQPRKKGFVPADPYTFRGLRKRYPLQYLLLNLLLGDPEWR
ncbi:MAG: Trp family transcriptional regulator, partial [Patescibacteria group bacterium]